MLVEWESKLNIGVPVIDAEHRYLVALVNNLHDSLSNDDGSVDLSHLFAHLIRYVGRHFRNEEALMEAIAYPAIDDHKKKHELLEDKTSDISELFLSEGNQVTAETMELLRDWLFVHVMSEDQEIGAFLSGKSVPDDWEHVPAFSQLSEDVFKQCTLCKKTWKTFDDLAADKEKTAVCCMADEVNHYYSLILFNCSCGTTLAIQLAELFDSCDLAFSFTKSADLETPPAYCLKNKASGDCIERCACAYTSKILDMLA